MTCLIQNHKVNCRTQLQPWWLQLLTSLDSQCSSSLTSLIARFMGPTWGPYGADRTLVGPMLTPWTLLSWVDCTSSSDGMFFCNNKRWIMLARCTNNHRVSQLCFHNQSLQEQGYLIISPALYYLCFSESSHVGYHFYIMFIFDSQRYHLTYYAANHVFHALV